MSNSSPHQEVSTRDLDGVQALRLFREGSSIRCRLCQALLVPVPEGVNLNDVHGLRCPTNMNHFAVFGEPAAPMKAMRSAMKTIAKRTD